MRARGSTPDSAASAVPTVDEILAVVGKQSSSATLIAVDLKDAGGGVEEAVVRLAEKHDVLSRSGVHRADRSSRPRSGPACARPTRAMQIAATGGDARQRRGRAGR